MNETERLRTAGRLMRDQHGPEHERHEMWVLMADLLQMAADHTEGHGPRDTCRSCVWQTVAVADAYLAPAPTTVVPGGTSQEETP